MGHAETDCRAVLERLYLFLDGEIAGEECTAIEIHLEACVYCLRHYSLERDFKQFVHRTCSEGGVPAGLVDRIRAEIRQALAE
jgi:mycothiol system anti-sigma-R factor